MRRVSTPAGRNFTQCGLLAWMVHEWEYGGQVHRRGQTWYQKKKIKTAKLPKAAHHAKKKSIFWHKNCPGHPTLFQLIFAHFGHFYTSQKTKGKQIKKPCCHNDALADKPLPCCLICVHPVSRKRALSLRAPSHPWPFNPPMSIRSPPAWFLLIGDALRVIHRLGGDVLLFRLCVCVQWPRR